MGIKDKLKRTSRIFLSDSKEDLAKNGDPRAGDEGTQTATGSAGVEPDSPVAANDSPTDIADGTLASSGDPEGAARDARGVSDSAPDAPTNAGEPGAEPDAEGAENGAVKRRGSFKRVKSKAKKPEAKKTEFFSKFMKKFKRPVGVPPKEPAEKAEKAERAEEAETAVRADSAGNAAQANATAASAADAPDVSLDPTSEATEAAGAAPVNK